jgi:hypothetical protein
MPKHECLWAAIQINSVHEGNKQQQNKTKQGMGGMGNVQKIGKRY